MDRSIFSTTFWIGFLFGMLAEMILKDEQLITTVFKVIAYTDIAHASAPNVPGRFFSI